MGVSLQELSKKALGREESFQNGLNLAENEAVAVDDEVDQTTSEFKHKKVRATTGDLAKFLRSEHGQEHAAGRNADLPSPHGNYTGLHVDHQLLSNTASFYSLATDITGTTGLVCKICFTFA